MTAPRVRTDYEQLKAIANGFGSQAQATQKTLQSLQRALDVLQGGDWVGAGATAFYQEMRSQVLPAMRRLATALESAQQATLNIHQTMAQAEAEAARWLRGDGAGPAAAVGSSFVGQAGPGSGSATGGPGGSGGTSGLVGGSVAAGPAGTTAPPRSPLANAVARLIAQENAAVDRRLAQFSPRVRDLVKRSPHLRAQILELDQANWTIQAGAPGTGFSTDRAKTTIRIEQPMDDEQTVSLIAHEVGHAVDKSKFVPSKPFMTRDEYVDEAVEFSLRSEGRAQFNAVWVRAELRAAGGPDIGIPGGQDAAFQQVYADTVGGKITHAQAVQQMGALMANERPSPVRNVRFATYRDMYRDFYNFVWDVDIDEPPPPPRRP